MPTGYTCGVRNGEVIELKDYILQCARNFGACVHMRGDGISSDIKYREVGEYYPRRLENIRKEFEEFKLLSDEEIQKQLDESYERRVQEQKEGLKRFDERKQRYLDMIDKVKEWIPPTKDHIGLKEFALEQLNNSLEFDCSDSSRNYYLQEPFKDTVEGYKAWKIKSYLKDLEYYSKSYREELENAEKANKWITDLYESLKG